MKNGQSITRVCKKCSQTKPIFEFPVYDKRNEWRRHECQDCYCQRMIEHYEANKARRRETARARYHANPAAHWTPERRARANELARRSLSDLRRAIVAKYGGVCACCGETEPLFLTIDHVNNDGKQQRKEHGINAEFYRWIIKRDYPEGFQVLCMNCNWGKQRNGGVCPHKGIGKVHRLFRKEVRRKRMAAEAPSPSLFGG